VETILGLPAHPLVVHLAVVLLPLAAIGGLIMGLAPRFSVRFGPLIVAVAGGGVVAAIAARLTGERLSETIPAPEAHVQAGNLLPLGAAVYFVLVLALWLLDRRGRRALGAQILAVLVIVTAILLTGWVALAGHTGAESVWQGIAQQLGSR
jgi:hypothetical protein